MDEEVEEAEAVIAFEEWLAEQDQDVVEEVEAGLEGLGADPREPEQNFGPLQSQLVEIVRMSGGVGEAGARAGAGGGAADAGVGGIRERDDARVVQGITVGMLVQADLFGALFSEDSMGDKGLQLGLDKAGCSAAIGSKTDLTFCLVMSEGKNMRPVFITGDTVEAVRVGCLIILLSLFDWRSETWQDRAEDKNKNAYAMGVWVFRGDTHGDVGAAVTHVKERGSRLDGDDAIGSMIQQMTMCSAPHRQLAVWEASVPGALDCDMIKVEGTRPAVSWAVSQLVKSKVVRNTYPFVKFVQERLDAHQGSPIKMKFRVLVLQKKARVGMAAGKAVPLQ